MDITKLFSIQLLHEPSHQFIDCYSNNNLQMSSSLKSTDFTLQVCPLNTAKQSSRLTSQSLTVWSPDAVTC